MAAPGRTVVRVGRALERFVESRQAAPAVGAAALAVYALVSIGLPLRAGRDLARYLLTYAQLVDAHVVFPNALVARTPGTPLVTGLLLEAGPVVSEVGAAALYAGSIVAWFCVARRFGPAAALATAAALLAVSGLRPPLPSARERRALRGRLRARGAPPRARRRAPDGHACRSARSRCRRGRVRPSGRSGARAPRPRSAPRGPWPFPSGGWCRVRDRGARAARLAGGPQRSAGRRLHGRPRRLRLAALPDVRRRQARRARQRRGVRGACARRCARALAERAVPVAWDRARDVLLVGQLAHARRPHRARRPDLGLGRRLPPPRPRGARGDPRASDGVRPRCRPRSLEAACSGPSTRPSKSRRRPRRTARRSGPSRGQRRRPTTSRSRRRERRRPSRPPTAGSGRCGPRRPTTRSSSATLPTAFGPASSTRR